MHMNECFRYLHVGLPDDIQQRKLAGDLEGAVRLIDRRLKTDTVPEALRCCLTVQREMILRRTEDYPFTKEEALAVVRRSEEHTSELQSHLT